jgi:Cu/Ag efflux protein CusF
MVMQFPLKLRVSLLAAIAVVLTIGTWQDMSADDVVHIVKGVVKSVDKDSKTMVVKAEDGTEHTIKWTDKTTMEGLKDTSKGIEEGTKVSVKYTEKGGEKTAVGVKAAGKATAKAVE